MKSICDSDRLIISTYGENWKMHKTIAIWIGQIGRWIVNSLVRSSEIQIQPMKNRDGEEYWKIYNPYTGQTSYASSEHEVRGLIDQKVMF